MKLSVLPMDEEMAKETLSWRYEAPYELYNNEINQETVKERLSNNYKIVFDDKENVVFGYFCTGEAAQVPAGYRYGVYDEQFIDIGLGMNPAYTGKNMAMNFVHLLWNKLKHVIQVQL